MLQRHRKLIGYLVVFGAVICVGAYAGISYYEQEVSLDQVPTAAKATLLKEAGEGVIQKIERELELGKVIYEAEVIIDGKKIEIEVAADGTLQSKGVDDDDDADNDDDDDDDK
ncbi:MAG: hypothetical protein AMJ79_15365 [Phycisphaerae bacterium SM23_30]|nr:MAG: hypothetical protein AMJ79_15365 [Phycisphaerae bacterium SM23_30]